MVKKFKIIDLISLSPSNNVLQGKTNKKTVGAVLFLFFFVVDCFLIIPYYILQYKFCDDYKIKSFVS